jgi:hypothetical protein
MLEFPFKINGPASLNTDSVAPATDGSQNVTPSPMDGVHGANSVFSTVNR